MARRKRAIPTALPKEYINNHFGKLSRTRSTEAGNLVRHSAVLRRKQRHFQELYPLTALVTPINKPHEHSMSRGSLSEPESDPRFSKISLYFYGAAQIELFCSALQAVSFSFLFSLSFGPFFSGRARGSDNMKCSSAGPVPVYVPGVRE